MSKTFINIIHRADQGAKELEGLQFQQDAAHRYGLSTTVLVSYSALHDAAVISYVRQQQVDHGDELGLHFHSLLCDDYRERFGTECRHFYLLPLDMKRAIVDRMMLLFQQHFGFLPRAIGSYVLDAQTIKYIREVYPSVGVGIVNCFEEGIKMFEGNDHGWYLFSDGGPWGPYHVSTVNHLCPARGPDDDSGLIGLPHLNRDMLLSVASRDDYFASHPLNLARARINQGDDCPYMYRFIDQWMRQAEFNGYGYYNVFVSIPWILEGCPFVESQALARVLYDRNLGYLREKVDQGAAVAVTMSEFGTWYRRNREQTKAEVVLWNDILCGSKRQLFWYADAAFRIAIDPNSGGSICDLRPYAGRVERNIGPAEPNLWDGSYPHLINTENLGGPGATGQSAAITIRGKTAMLYDRRTTCTVERTAAGSWRARMAPVPMEIAGVCVTIESIYTFEGEGRLAIDRRVLETSHPSEDIVLTEVHRGCWGTTIYPADLRGAELRIGDSKGNMDRCIEVCYTEQKAILEDAGWVEALLPMAKCRVRLRAESRRQRGKIADGYLFKPFYTLELSETVPVGGALRTMLLIESL